MSYTPIVLSTLFMLYIGKYYQGPITRRSIFTLMNGRSFSFILKGILFYFFIQWFVGYSLGNPYILYVIADYTSWVVDIFADINAGTEGLYKYYYTYVVPALRDTASNIVWTMMLFAISPYFIIFFKSYVIRVKKQKIKELFIGQTGKDDFKVIELTSNNIDQSEHLKHLLQEIVGSNSNQQWMTNAESDLDWVKQFIKEQQVWQSV